MIATSARRVGRRRPDPRRSSAVAAGDRASGRGALGRRPGRPGDDLPPRGRSLFDFLVTQERGRRAGAGRPVSVHVRCCSESSRGRGAMRARGAPTAVLIPLGRSLQRNSAAPDFFAFPRAVVAVDRGAGGSRDPVPQGPAVSRLPGKGERHRGHQLQRGRRSIRIPGGHRLSCRRHAEDRLREPDVVHRLPPECGADLLARRLGRDERESRRGDAARVGAQGSSTAFRSTAASTCRTRSTMRRCAPTGSRSHQLSLERRLRRQRRSRPSRAAPACSRRCFAVPAFGAAVDSTAPMRRIAPEVAAPLSGGRAPAVARRPRDRQSRHSESQSAGAPRRRCRPRNRRRDRASSPMSPPRSIRCCRGRRSRSGASTTTTTWRVSSPASPISSPNPDVERLDNALLEQAGASARPRAHLSRRSARSSRARRATAASASNSAARRRRPRRSRRCARRSIVRRRQLARRAVRSIVCEIDGLPPSARSRSRRAASRVRAAAQRVAVLDADARPRSTRAARMAMRSSASNCAGAIATGPRALVVARRFRGGPQRDRRARARQPRGQVRRLRRAGLSPCAPDARAAAPSRAQRRRLVLHRRCRACRPRAPLAPTIPDPPAATDSSPRRPPRTRLSIAIARNAIWAPIGRRRISCSVTPTKSKRSSRHCAPRIYYRLSMWAARRDARDQDPDAAGDRAAPTSSSRDAAWRDGGALSGLLLSVNERLRAEGEARRRRRAAAPELREPARVPAGRIAPATHRPARPATRCRNRSHDTRQRSIDKGAKDESIQRCATGREVAPSFSRSAASHRRARSVSSALYLFQRFGGDTPVDYASNEEHFKYGSTGGEHEMGFPYWIWRALPQVCAGASAGSRVRIPGHDLRAGQGRAGRHFAASLSGRGSRVPQLRGLPYEHGAHRKGQGADGRVGNAGEQLRHHGVPEILLRLRGGSAVPQGIRDGGNRSPRREPRSAGPRASSIRWRSPSCASAC